MKFQFEPDLDFQQDAIAAVCDLFRGQEVCRGEFTVVHGLAETGLPGLVENDLGVGNRLSLRDDALLDNLREVQLRNGLLPAVSLEARDFTVEMETGTGKTYVYLRTILELHARYGFTKFAIVVPSIAIKEGVNKSLEMMGDHLRSLYSGVPFEHFVYDSAKLGQVRSFATSQQLQIMVVTVGAINKQAVNNIYQPNEKTGGEKPVDLVRAANPILIVDEPQSVDGGLRGRGREALAAMNPLCTLRYSATHENQYHMVYRLNAVDAYERELVKQIEVASATVADDHNLPYVRLVSVKRRGGVISATIELDVATSGGGVSRRQVSVQDGDDLRAKTRRELYQNHRIGEIRVGSGNEILELRVPGGERWLRRDEAYGSVDNLAVHRAMIRKTIEEHLDKEERLHVHGIKVLSLFFIDKVSSYRQYDADGQRVQGCLARLFEEEYRRMAGHPKYASLFEGIDLDDAIPRAHDGYFSVDKHGRERDTAESNQTDRDNAERAYNLIMRNKERMLSLDEPLKFIFSHSALREGWDNPNVFQICALRDMRTERARRQTIGRGLRLCVNQKGERQRGFQFNTLTVVAQESYEAFAENLQREIEQETGIRFGIVDELQFATIPVDKEINPNGHLAAEESKELWRHLVSSDYLDEQGKILDELRNALQDAADFVLPDRFEPLRDAIAEVLWKATGRVQVRPARERRRVKPREAILDGADFQALWERIKYKTTYRVQFDNEKLIADCTDALAQAPGVPRPRIQWERAGLHIERSGVQAQLSETGLPMSLLSDEGIALPDLLTEMQDRTHLTRRSLARILSQSGRLDDFRTNPQAFVEIAAQTINQSKRSSLVDGIQYQRLGHECYYAQELFTDRELAGYLQDMVESPKSVYDWVICDSSNEAAFAQALEQNAAVKLYAKLPRWFEVPTPLGAYRPDWAVLITDENGERLYFVVETKGSVFLDDLRNREKAKVECGKAHFAALQATESPARYTVAPTVENLMMQIMAV